MFWQKTALLATVLAVLLATQTSASFLQCYCSDCHNNNFCYGEACYAQIYLDLQTSVVSERWRCLNSTQLQLCNISYPITSYTCCDSHDFCNEDIHAFLPGTNENKTMNVTAQLINETMCGNESTLDTNSTVSCLGLLGNGTVNGTSVPINETTPTPDETTPTNINDSSSISLSPSATPLPPSPPSLVVPPGSIFECRVAETTNPHTFNFSFCETTEACFISLRVRSDKSRIYKWGCSRSACVEENRARKRKTCCHNWFCNGNVPTDWLESEGTTQTPTTPTTNITQPPPPNITIIDPSPGDDSPNCTVAEGNPLHLSPCVGPGSVPVLVPTRTEPVPNPSGYFCYCNTCDDHYLCHSQYGCATTFTAIYDLTVSGGYRVHLNRFCIPDEEYFQKCGVQYNLECCLASLCNLHNASKTTPTPTNDSTTEPITVATSTHQTESPTNQITDHTVHTLPPTEDDPSETDSKQDNKQEEEDESLLYYTLSGLLTAVVIAVIVVMVLLCLCCYRYRKRFGKKPPSSSPRRLQPRGVNTRGGNSVQDVSWRPSGTLLSDRALEEGPRDIAADFRKTENSGNTASTYAQSSTPESTV